MVGLRDHPLILHLLHQTRRLVVADAQFALDVRRRAFAVFGHDGHGLIVQAVIVAAAKAEMQADLASELRHADAEIAARTAESERALTAIRDQAMVSVSEVARDTAGALVAALGGNADAARIEAALAARTRG